MKVPSGAALEETMYQAVDTSEGASAAPALLLYPRVGASSTVNVNREPLSDKNH